MPALGVKRYPQLARESMKAKELEDIRNKINEDEEKEKEKEQLKAIELRRKDMFKLFRKSIRLKTKMSSIPTIFEEVEEISERQETEDSNYTKSKLEDIEKDQFDQEDESEDDYDDYGILKNQDIYDEDKDNVNLQSPKDKLIRALNKNNSVNDIKTFTTDLGYANHHNGLINKSDILEPNPSGNTLAPTNVSSKVNLNISIRKSKIKSKISLKANDNDYKRMHRKMRSRMDENIQTQSWKETNASRLKRLLHQSPSRILPPLKTVESKDRLRSMSVDPVNNSISMIINKCNDYALQDVISIDK